MIDPGEQPVYEVLDRLQIAYDRYEHPAVFTAEDALAQWASIPAAPCKNLFLRNKKGNRHYLVILSADQQADLHQLVKRLGDDRLSFGSPERLKTQLGLTPGAVSPFGLVHNTDKSLQVVIDAALKSATRLIFHPNVNTASLTISVSDLIRFLEWAGNPVRWITL